LPNPKRPVWVDHPPRQSETLYFVGVKTSAETIEEGRDAAMKNALSKISDYLGCKVESTFEEHTTDIKQQVKHKITTSSNTIICGAELADLYAEKLVRLQGDVKIENCNVYVLVSLAKAEILRYVKQQEMTAREKAGRAYDFYLKGLNLEKEKKYHDARGLYLEAVRLLDEIGDSTTILSQATRDGGELMPVLRTRLKQVEKRLSRVMLSIKLNVAPSTYDAFTPGLVSALSKDGFSVVDKEPAWEIRGEAGLRECTSFMNAFLCYAEGNVSAIRIPDREIAIVVPFKAKGFHRIRRQAELNALSEAGFEVGTELVKMLLEQEEKDLNPAGR